MENYKGVTEADLGWLAGILDGEGSFSVHRNQRPQRNQKGTYFTWGMVISIVNSNPRLLQRCVELIVAITNKQPSVALKQPGCGKNPLKVFSLRVYGKQHIRALLEAVMPYLVGKSDEAKLLLEFVRSAEGTGYERIHDRDYAERTIETMKQLKRPHVNAELILAGLRSLGQRIDYGVTPKNNPRTSVPPEKENIVRASAKAEEAADKEPLR